MLAVLWLLLFVGRTRTFAPELQSVRARANDQAIWIANETSIRQRYDQAVADLKAQGKELKGARAYATIDQLVRASNLGFRIDPLTSTRREQLTFYTINATVSKADYTSLRSLFDQIMTALPNVNLDEVTIAAPERNAKVVDAKFKFVAIEINP